MKNSYNEEEIEIDEIDEDFDVDAEITPIDYPIISEPKVRKKKEKSTEIYVEPSVMWDHIRKYYEAAEMQEYPTIDPTLATMIDDIATKVGYRPNFINYSYKSEMIGDAKLKMFKALRDRLFRLHTHTKIVKKEVGAEKTFYYYYDKKNRLKKKSEESTDVVEIKDGVEYITFRNSAFAYYTHICFNAYLNRIKKEHLIDQTKKEYQEDVWERQLASEGWKNVRRPRYMEADENDSMEE